MMGIWKKYRNLHTTLRGTIFAILAYIFLMIVELVSGHPVQNQALNIVLMIYIICVINLVAIWDDFIRLLNKQKRKQSYSGKRIRRSN